MFVVCTMTSVVEDILGNGSKRTRTCTVFEGSEDACVAFIKNQAKDSLNVFMETDLRIRVIARIDNYAYVRIVVDDILHVPNVVYSTEYELSSFEF